MKFEDKKLRNVLDLNLYEGGGVEKMEFFYFENNKKNINILFKICDFYLVAALRLH